MARAILIVFITLLTVFLFVMLVTSKTFNFSALYLVAIFIFMLFVLGPGWPSTENKNASESEPTDEQVQRVVGLRFLSYFLRFFCTIISINFIFSLFTGSIYINIVGRNHGALKQVSFNDSPYIFALAFLFSGYIFVKSMIWLWPKLRNSLTPPSSGTC